MHLSKFSAVDGRCPKKVNIAYFRTIWSTVFIVRRSPKTNVSKPPQEISAYAPALYCVLRKCEWRKTWHTTSRSAMGNKI